MSRESAAATGRRYGLERVCQVLECPRSTIYARRAADQRKVVALRPRRRGPKPRIGDAKLLQAIRADLAASPFVGEGHRKPWARLRLAGIRVARARVLRLMRENPLLSPHRRPQGTLEPHEGTITTERPDQMWGTDAVRIQTVEDGWVWTFSAVDHCHGECVGWHVTKIGDRFAALEPIAQGRARYFGGVQAQAGRGLALRMDHGTQYMADHFLNQVKYWGIAPSFAFVAEPQTNGVVERFNRTLKEQAIYGRVFRNIEEVRRALAEFVERYNAHWRLEKLDFKTPYEVRQAARLKQAA